MKGPWIIVLAALALLAGVVLLRRTPQPAPPEAEQAVPARIPAHGKNVHVGAGSSMPLRGTHFDDAARAAEEGVSIAARAQARVSSGTPVARHIAPARQRPMRNPNETAQPEAPAEVAGEPVAQRTASNGAVLSLSFNGSGSIGDQAPPLVAQGIEFDPTIGAAHFPPTATLAYPDSGGLSPEEGTVALWMRMEPGEPVTRTIIELRTQTWENRLEFGLGPTYIGLLLTNSDGVEQAAGTSINWAPGDWHHVATTWGEALMSIYIDGALADQRPFSGSLVIPPDARLYLASASRGPEGQKGTMSWRDLNLFQRALQADEIAMLTSQNPPPQ